MEDITRLTVHELVEKLNKNELSSEEIVKAYKARIEDKEKDVKAFITTTLDEAEKEAVKVDEERKSGAKSSFAGVPIGIKDNLCTNGVKTTCASKMLENFVAPYNATVVEKLNNEGVLSLGKLNMDEFAMGASTEYSAFKVTRNPWNLKMAPGGSSGGSAAAVASQMVPWALGSDTGGSIRQPASFCGIVGLKPTYGRVSRYGLIAFGSSLDQIGPMTKNVYENAILLNTICGKSEKDLTSVETNEDFTRLIGEKIDGMKIAIPNFYVSNAIDKEIKDKLNEVIEILKKHNCTIDYVDINYIDKAVPLYQIIAMGEASSNLARFDGIRYGYSYENPKDIEDLYLKTRKIGFGDEVKRRIMIGSYLLSGKNAKLYYNKALEIRDDMRKSFLETFKNYDLVIGPNNTTVAYELDKGLDDAIKSFMDDVLTIPVNMAGLPGMSVPIGFNSENLPIGMQIIGAPFEEAKMYQLASFVEKELNLDLNPNGGEKHD